VERRRCKDCGRLFVPSPRVGERQSYCRRKECQRTRKRLWTREKLRRDEAYRLNQARAQKSWRERNPGYWKRYREKRPEYAERNREAQKMRNRRRRTKEASDFASIANMDAIRDEKRLLSGIYTLRPVQDQPIANMDAIMVEIRSVSGGYSALGPDCKQMTR
jgi:hypothetical protein